MIKGGFQQKQKLFFVFLKVLDHFGKQKMMNDNFWKVEHFIHSFFLDLS